MIEFKNVSKSFSNKEVLKHINITFEDGKVTTIIGPSGTGKSTLIRMVNRLEELDDGSDKVVLLDCKHDNYYAASFGSNISYFETTKQELEKIQLPIEYLDTIEPSKILDKCIEKVENNIFVKQAEPFYIKKSSAERLK